MKVPAFMLKKLYVPKSLQNGPEGASFRLKNTMASATLVAAPRIVVDGETIPPGDLLFRVEDQQMTADQITPQSPIEFKKGVEVVNVLKGRELPPGSHKIKIAADSREWQTLEFDFEDSL